MVRERGQKMVATNRKARHGYHILDVLEAGIVLTGTDVKNLGNYRSKSEGLHQRALLEKVVGSHLLASKERDLIS